MAIAVGGFMTPPARTKKKAGNLQRYKFVMKSPENSTVFHLVWNGFG